ncbi:hypothetical protein BOTBODRAFT_32547 [Botryobasidium botryosum FD-172 SS1]|uniref:Uncharacterized protein n=1 Tax=Botryobasidium botryosum (strain FD-172 SS1) TaxID=930990 RepID=A0A067MGY4_BOTB1|nr:hypothetical protein BOTBODRAFT_32547 [Botryobasidium botryosum FD-172 SS1]
MSSAPLLHGYSEDVKYHDDPELPTHAAPIDGGETPPDDRRGGCRRRCRGNRKNKARKAFRIVGAIATLWFVFTAVRLFIFWHNFEHPICTPLSPDTDTVSLIQPLASELFVHSTLAGDKVAIVHDEKIPEGAFQVTVKSGAPGLGGGEIPAQLCVLRGKRGSWITLATPSREVPAPHLASTVLSFPISVEGPAIKFIGKTEWRFKSKLVNRILRWWIHHEDKKPGDGNEDATHC